MYDQNLTGGYYTPQLHNAIYRNIIIISNRYCWYFKRACVLFWPISLTRKMFEIIISEKEFLEVLIQACTIYQKDIPETSEEITQLIEKANNKIKKS